MSAVLVYVCVFVYTDWHPAVLIPSGSDSLTLVDALWLNSYVIQLQPIRGQKPLWPHQQASGQPDVYYVHLYLSASINVVYQCTVMLDSTVASSAEMMSQLIN